MIKAILFDLDGVLQEEYDEDRIYREISKLYSVNYDKVRQVFEKYDELYYLGKLSNEEFWKKICLDLNVVCDINILNLILFKEVKDNNWLINFIRENKGKYKFGIITTNFIEVEKCLEDKYGSLFDFYLTSARVGCDKKKEDIFNVALSLINCKSCECVFVDNKISNLVIPEKMGFNIYEYEFGKDDFTDFFEKMGSPF